MANLRDIDQNRAIKWLIIIILTPMAAVSALWSVEMIIRIGYNIFARTP